MIKIAIKGHQNRGMEVIKLLEMLGGKNTHYIGVHTSSCYTITDDTLEIIKIEEHTARFNNCKIFTLEEFEEKYPYKIGDKVINIDCPDEIGEVFELYWDDSNDDILYGVRFKERYYWYDVDSIKLFERKYENDECGINLKQLEKETKESLEEFFFGEPEPQPKAPILSNRYDYADGKCGYVIPDGYEFDSIKQGFQTEIILRPIKSQYPKTYEECGVLLNSDNKIKMHTIGSFAQLINARNAYWKIAGEQMGLGKPWKPDFTDTKEMYYIFYKGYIEKGNQRHPDNHILIFPTEEMRDVFYENFKELIEQCKELL